MKFSATTRSRTTPGSWLMLPALLVAICSPRVDAQPVLEERARALTPLIAAEFRLREFSIQSLSIPQSRSESAAISIRLADGDHQMTIAPHRVFGPNYRLLVDLGDDRIEALPEGEVETFRGTITDIPGSIVAGGRAGEGLTARIILPDEQTYWIEPIQDRIQGATATEHIIYRSEDALPHDGACGTLDEDIAKFAGREVENGTRGGGCGGGICVTDLACDADVEYLSDYGSVANVQTRIATVINAMNAQYESQVGITHQIGTILVRTVPTYSSNNANILLDEFSARWNANHTGIPRDIAHLFTGKNLQAPTIGIAWVGVICANTSSGLGYSLVESDFNGNFSCATDLSAHELGHNWSANHCSCPGNTMNPSITCANSFSSTFTIPGIISFRDSRGCLSPFESGTTPLPFADDFPSTALDASKWTGIEGAESNALGNGEPSASNSLNIDGSDQIRSAIIDTSVPLGLDLSYFWQRTGSGNSPEANEDLIVEYLNSSQLWVELTRYPGTGSDSDPFQLDSFEMPTDALHDSFRLRFRGVSSNTGLDDWFIDDINIDGCYGATVAPQPQPASGCPGDNVQFTTAGTGGEPISYQWLKDGIVLNNGGGISGATTNTLSINGISDPADEGDYTCEITNECGTLSTQAGELAVFDPVSITTQPAALITGCTGDTRIITVGAAGDGLTYEWRKDGVLLSNGGNISGATTASLSVSNLSLSDIANTPGYVCTVFDNCGNFVDSSAAELDITGAEIITDPEDACANDGQMATFTASYVAPDGATLILQWHKDGAPLSNGGNISGAFTDTLTINPASPADIGGYSLRIVLFGPNCIVFSNEAQLTIDDCGCQSAAECDDSNPCTDDICDGVLGCINPNNSLPCDDGNACTTDDACSAGACAGGTPLVCDDTNVCTDDTCNPATGCEFTNNTNACDDGNACTTVDACDTGACVGSAPLICDDTNICTDDTCNPATGCEFANNTNPCDDSDACTTVDTCAGGSCVGSDPLVCDDGDFCNGTESCDSGSGCVPGIDPCDGSTWCDESGDQCIAFGDGDFNFDGGVDLLDFQAFQACFGAPASGGCQALNLTGDAVVDMDDFEAFEGLLTGP